MTFHIVGSFTRVGRWMSLQEGLEMIRTGKVQESFSGTTHVALPAEACAFVKQAAPDSLYIEFNVPSSSLVDTGNGWAKIIGPNSLQGRLAARKKQAVPQMPRASDIVCIVVKPL